MNVPPLTAVSPASQQSPQLAIEQSCRQFEAGLWKSVLEKALASSGGAATGNEVYQYFMGDTLAQQISGLPGGIACSLQAQLMQAGAKETV